jgi:hypothetical protein
MQVSKGHNLYVTNPILTEEWHPTKNQPLTPEDVTPNSNRKVWWMCKKRHEWHANINDRSSGNGCPFCSNRYVNIDNCLQTKNPKLSLEWHPTKNVKLKPSDVVPNSHKKVWWKCKKGHEWQANVSSRNRGGGCPYCSNKAVNNENCLQTINPIISKEWHPTKNQPLTPLNVTPNSGKKVWWMCKKGHEWQAIIYNRNRGTGCPLCRNK